MMIGPGFSSLFPSIVSFLHISSSWFNHVLDFMVHMRKGWITKKQNRRNIRTLFFPNEMKKKDSCIQLDMLVQPQTGDKSRKMSSTQTERKDFSHSLPKKN